MSSNPLPRITQQIFSGSAPTDELAVFGSMKTGAPVYTSNLAQLMGSTAYTLGFQDAVLEDDAPYLEETNGLFYGITSQLAYLFQKGIPEWDADTQYFTNSFCQYNGIIYQSTVDNNIGLQPDTNSVQWEELKTGGGSSSESVGDMPMFTGMWFDFKPNQAGWAPANTVLSREVYPTCYNTLVACLQAEGNIYNLQVIDETQKQPNVDYSLYWVVNQIDFTFTTPSKISWVPLTGEAVPVVGNGMSIGFNAGGTNNFTLGVNTAVNAMSQSVVGYGTPVGTSIGNTGAPVHTTAGLTTDPTTSGAIATLSSGISSTAQLYFKVGNTIINEEFIDVGSLNERLLAISTELATKVTAEDACYAVGPQISYSSNPTYVQLTVGAKGNQVAVPVNCWARLEWTSSASNERVCFGLGFGYFNLQVNSSAANQLWSLLLYAPKGYQLFIDWSGNPKFTQFFYYPVNGSN